MESIKGHPEHVETVFGEAIVARDEALVVLAGACGLGPPDLCWLQKASKSALTGATGEARGYYHCCLGVDASSSAAVAAYFATLTSFVEPPTFLQGLFSTSEMRIERGFYCCYDPLTRLDVRCELCIPGGVVCGALDCEGNVHDVTPDLWRNCVVATFLRSELYDAELVSHSAVPVARYPPLPTPSDELRLLAAVAGLYEDGVLPEALEALTVDQSGGVAPEHADVVLHTLLHYFARRQRWGTAMDFFSRLSATYPTAALYVAAVQRECGLYNEALSTLSHAVDESPDDPVLLAGLATECLYSDQVEASMRGATRAARLRPSLRPAWLALARAHVRLGAGPAALVVLNLVPPPPLPGKEVAMLHVIAPPEPKSTTKPAVPSYDLDIVSARQVLSEEAVVHPVPPAAAAPGAAAPGSAGAGGSACLPGALMVPREPPDAAAAPDTSPLRITRAVLAAVYTVLQELVAVSGWDGFLRLRSAVFVMHADSDVLREQQKEAEDRERQLKLLHRQLSATLPPSPSWVPQPPVPVPGPPVGPQQGAVNGRPPPEGEGFEAALDEAAVMGLAEYPEHLEDDYDDPRVAAAREAHRRHLREIAERQARLEAAEGGAYADDEWDGSSPGSDGGGGGGGGPRSANSRSRRNKGRKTPGVRRGALQMTRPAVAPGEGAAARQQQLQQRLEQAAAGADPGAAAPEAAAEPAAEEGGVEGAGVEATATVTVSMAVGPDDTQGSAAVVDGAGQQKGGPGDAASDPAADAPQPQSDPQPQPASSSLGWWGTLFGGGESTAQPRWREPGPLGEACEVLRVLEEPGPGSGTMLTLWAANGREQGRHCRLAPQAVYTPGGSLATAGQLAPPPLLRLCLQSLGPPPQLPSPCGGDGGDKGAHAAGGTTREGEHARGVPTLTRDQGRAADGWASPRAAAAPTGAAAPAGPRLGDAHWAGAMPVETAQDCWWQPVSSPHQDPPALMLWGPLGALFGGTRSDYVYCTPLAQLHKRPAAAARPAAPTPPLPPPLALLARQPASPTSASAACASGGTQPDATAGDRPAPATVPSMPPSTGTPRSPPQDASAPIATATTTTVPGGSGGADPLDLARGLLGVLVCKLKAQAAGYRWRWRQRRLQRALRAATAVAVLPCPRYGAMAPLLSRPSFTAGSAATAVGRLSRAPRCLALAQACGPAARRRGSQVAAGETAPTSDILLLTASAGKLAAGAAAARCGAAGVSTSAAVAFGAPMLLRPPAAASNFGPVRLSGPGPGPGPVAEAGGDPDAAAGPSGAQDPDPAALVPAQGGSGEGGTAAAGGRGPGPGSAGEDGFPLVLQSQDTDRQMVLEGLDVAELGAKRLCARWLDELIVALWHDLQSFLDWKALDSDLSEAGFRSHAEIVAGTAPAPTPADYQRPDTTTDNDNSNPADDSGGASASLPPPPPLPSLPAVEWLRRGLLAERLHHEADALAAYQAAVMTPPPTAGGTAAGSAAATAAVVFAAVPGGGPGAFSMIAWQAVLRLAPAGEPRDTTWALRAVLAIMTWLEWRAPAGTTAVPFTSGFLALGGTAAGAASGGGAGGRAAAPAAAAAAAVAASGGKLHACPLTVVHCLHLVAAVLGETGVEAALQGGSTTPVGAGGGGAGAGPQQSGVSGTSGGGGIKHPSAAGAGGVAVHPAAAAVLRYALQAAAARSAPTAGAGPGGSGSEAAGAPPSVSSGGVVPLVQASSR